MTTSPPGAILAALLLEGPLTYRLLALLLATLILFPTVASARSDEQETDGCPPLPERALKKIARVMDLVQAQQAEPALALADSVVKDYPCHVSYQARASCEQLCAKHHLAIDDFRRAYGLVKESYDLEGMARSAIAVGDLDLAIKVGRALRAFRYRSAAERARGLRCVEAIAAAGNMLLDTQQEAARERPVAHRSDDVDESE